MSIRAMTLVFERSRAKGSPFLMLLGIADYAKDDGRGAYPSAQTLGWKARLTGRAGRLILEKLVNDGEVWPEWDAVERRLYLHVRCVCDWTAYQQEGVKPDRQWEKISDSQREKFSLRLAQLGAERHLARRTTAENRKNSPFPSSSTDPLDPSEEDPSEERRAREARPPSASHLAYVAVWNGSMAGTPIPQVQTLTPKRRRLLGAAQLEHPPAQWARLCTAIAASRFLGGANDRGWTASFDWLIGSPDPAIRVLEGQFDDHRPAQRPPGLSAFPEFACPHTPICAGRSACDVRTRLDAAKAKAS